MAGQRIDIMDLKQLIQLKGKGCSNRHIARQLGVSRNTVNGYVQGFAAHSFSYGELDGLSEQELAELFPQADYKDLAAWSNYIIDTKKCDEGVLGEG
ncbi:MAG: response regulator transcription factor [Bacteroidia bacterium]|nr:response regulator transcription factor [Bacteroidia bacterium]